MRKIIIIVACSFLFLPSYSQVQLYLGVRGGAGVMLTRDQLNNLATSSGFVNATNSSSSWSLHAKGEALIGFGRLRLGYQFLYNFAQTGSSSSTYSASIDNNRNTTYFNSSQTTFLGHYFLAEVAVIKLPHFVLAPGIALGSFTGFKVDNTTGDRVELSADTHHRFSAGAELNFELKFGRFTFLASPNYYLFTLQDKGTSSWREYQHFIGADLGFRVNLLKP
jgi:hypothetical protein